MMFLSLRQSPGEVVQERDAFQSNRTDATEEEGGSGASACFGVFQGAASCRCAVQSAALQQVVEPHPSIGSGVGKDHLSGLRS